MPHIHDVSSILEQIDPFLTGKINGIRTQLLPAQNGGIRTPPDQVALPEHAECLNDPPDCPSFFRSRSLRLPYNSRTAFDVLYLSQYVFTRSNSSEWGSWPISFE